MNTTMETGLYGKLPAYGDFIFRNLNATFINPWDEWQQNFISASQQQIGADWLDIYLTSPIWRFVISAGVIDNKVWAGFMMPSVDRVGRYFPVTVVQPFDSRINPVNLMFYSQRWFDQLEVLCLQALEGKIDADQLIILMSAIKINPCVNYLPTQDMLEMGPMLFDLIPTSEQSMLELMPYFLNASLLTGLSSYSLWMTKGSELISPVLFSCQGLPPVSGIASMLDGQWQQRNWKIPYNMNLQ